MKKLFALFLLVFATAAHAVELNPDIGFDSPGSWMIMGDTPHASVTGSKAVFTGATKMTMIGQASTAAKRPRKYRISFNISNYVSGSVMGYVGMTMMGSASSSYVSAVSLAGLAPISDNFTTSAGIEYLAELPPTDTDIVSAFRMSCGSGPIRPDDPIIYPGQYGRSHAHQFWGNTGVDASRDTYAKLRAKGMTTCGNNNTPSTPLNRSGYWMPAMDGGDGYFRKADIVKQYYKRIPDSSQECVAQGGTVGTCIPLPHGLRMIAGWKSSDNSQKMSDAGAIGNFACTDETESGGAHRSGGQDMNTVIGNAACIASYNAGSKPHLEIDFGFPECWDGLYVDTPDHRAHMAYPGNFTAGGILGNRCPSTHPYRIPGVQGGIFFVLDAQAFAGKWKLSSDTMFAGNAAGSTFHTDYFEAWSPTVAQTWYDNCITPHKSCSGGDLGNNTRLKSTSIPSSGGPSTQGGAPVGFNYVSPQHLIPTGVIGQGKPCKSNGTCTVEVISGGAAEFGLMTSDFNGQIDNLSVTPISSGAKGPVAVTH